MSLPQKVTIDEIFYLTYHLQNGDLRHAKVFWFDNGDKLYVDEADYDVHPIGWEPSEFHHWLRWRDMGFNLFCSHKGAWYKPDQPAPPWSR